MASFVLQMSRPSQVISLIVFLSLLPFSEQYKKIHENSNAIQLKTHNGDVRDIIPCKSGHCTTGNYRKLITDTISSSTNNIKFARNVKKEVSKQKGTVMEHGNSLPNSENHEALEHTSDSNVEITEMDYSPPSKKPPIHN